MSKPLEVDWLNAYQAYQNSGLRFLTFLAQEMPKYCTGRVPARATASHHFRLARQQLAEETYTSSPVNICCLDENQMQSVAPTATVKGGAQYNNEHVVKVFVAQTTIAVAVKNPHIFIADLIKRVQA